MLSIKNLGVTHKNMFKESFKAGVLFQIFPSSSGRQHRGADDKMAALSYMQLSPDQKSVLSRQNCRSIVCDKSLTST